MTVSALQIRSLGERPDAASLLAEWYLAEWPEYHRGRSLPDIASRFRLKPEVEETLIAEIDGGVVGCVSLRGPWEGAPDIPPPWIGGLYVVPDRRGAGIGTALVDAAMEAAARLGYESVHVSVRIDPASYIRRGWRIVGTVFRGDEKVTVLRKETATV